jgi:predicted DNA-binding transcriptional regulator YafY
VVDPLGLVAKGRLWYFVAAVDDEPRTYRISRMQAVEILSEPATRPPDFDLAAFWTESSASLVANLPRYPIVVRAAPEIVRRLWIPGAYARVEQIGEPEADGWQTAHLLLQTEHEACSYVLGFGPLMEVIEPPALRERVIQTAEQIGAFYRERAESGPPRRDPVSSGSGN